MPSVHVAVRNRAIPMALYRRVKMALQLGVMLGGEMSSSKKV